MSGERTYGEGALQAVMVRHVQQCGLPLRSELPTVVAGELVYGLVCPRCGKYVASVILDAREARR